MDTRNLIRAFDHQTWLREQLIKREQQRSASPEYRPYFTAEQEQEIDAERFERELAEQQQRRDSALAMDARLARERAERQLEQAEQALTRFER